MLAFVPHTSGRVMGRDPLSRIPYAGLALPAPLTLHSLTLSLSTSRYNPLRHVLLQIEGAVPAARRLLVHSEHCAGHICLAGSRYP